jgi:tetratricopeptide (TPR) repeat protein
MVEQALRHKPFIADQYLNSIGTAYDLAGQPEEAIAPLQQYLSHYPNVLGAHRTLAAVYSELGRGAEARAEVAEVLRLNPRFSLEVHRESAYQRPGGVGASPCRPAHGGAQISVNKQ